MTAPTPSVAEIERLAAWTELTQDRIANGQHLLPHRNSGEFLKFCREALPLFAELVPSLLRSHAAALRELADARSDADNDRSRYKAQIEGLEREGDEAERHAENQRSEISRLRHWEEASKQQIEAQSVALADTRRERDEARRMLAEADEVIDWEHVGERHMELSQSEFDLLPAPDDLDGKIFRAQERHASRLAAAKERKPDG